MKEAWECRAHFCCHAQGREHNGKKAPVSHTGLVQAVRQTSPQLVSSLQGQVTLSQIFFRKCGWLKQACTSSELHSPVKVIDLEVRAQQNRFSTSGPVTAGYSQTDTTTNAFSEPQHLIIIWLHSSHLAKRHKTNYLLIRTKAPLPRRNQPFAFQHNSVLVFLTAVGRAILLNGEEIWTMLCIEIYV